MNYAQESRNKNYNIVGNKHTKEHTIRLFKKINGIKNYIFYLFQNFLPELNSKVNISDKSKGFRNYKFMPMHSRLIVISDAKMIVATLQVLSTGGNN